MKLPYSEGSVFLVPLNGGGYARGVVARSPRKGRVLLGYFFGPALATVEEAVVIDLSPKDAILCIRFGDLGLIRGDWPIIGSIPNWERTEWPMPDFVRKFEFASAALLVRYSDSDPTKIETQFDTDPNSTLERDGLNGYSAVQAVLSHLLRQSGK